MQLRNGASNNPHRDFDTSDISESEIREYLLQEDIEQLLFNKEEVNIIDKKKAHKFKDSLRLAEKLKEME
jgi:hypothetical protein